MDLPRWRIWSGAEDAPLQRFWDVADHGNSRPERFAVLTGLCRTERAIFDETVIGSHSVFDGLFLEHLLSADTLRDALQVAPNATGLIVVGPGQTPEADYQLMFAP